jgi:hypothetical protein
MRKSSWIVLGICAALILCLGFAYLVTRSTTPELLTREKATAMIGQMQEAVKHKNINAIMSYVCPDPDTKVAGLDQDHIRKMLVGAFHVMKDPVADVTNLTFTGGNEEAQVAFDLAVRNDAPGQTSTDYNGHVALDLKRVDVTRVFGLFHTKEWRIVNGSQTGPDLTAWGDD